MGRLWDAAGRLHLTTLSVILGTVAAGTGMRLLFFCHFRPIRSSSDGSRTVVEAMQNR